MNKFSRKKIFEMTSEEMKWAGLACELNLQFVQELIKNNKAVKFNRTGENNYIIASKSFDKDNKYRITVFNEKGPSGHYDRPNSYTAAKEVFSWIPHYQEYVIPEEVI